MVHNGIEYGLMQAYAEGFEIMHASDYELDLAAISELWMQGSVVRSWLLELPARAFRSNGQDLEHLKGFVADSGEGRWTVQEAIDHDVPAPIITLSLLTRFRSRQDDSLRREGPGRAPQRVRRPRGQDRVAHDGGDASAKRDGQAKGPAEDVPAGRGAAPTTRRRPAARRGPRTRR